MSTRLSMARTKAAVLPVPDCDWAIRFCGLPQTRRGQRQRQWTRVREIQVKFDDDRFIVYQRVRYALPADPLDSQVLWLPMDPLAIHGSVS